MSRYDQFARFEDEEERITSEIEEKEKYLLWIEEYPEKDWICDWCHEPQKGSAIHEEDPMYPIKGEGCLCKQCARDAIGIPDLNEFYNETQDIWGSMGYKWWCEQGM